MLVCLCVSSFSFSFVSIIIVINTMVSPSISKRTLGSITLADGGLLCRYLCGRTRLTPSHSCTSVPSHSSTSFSGGAMEAVHRSPCCGGWPRRWRPPILRCCESNSTSSCLFWPLPSSTLSHPFLHHPYCNTNPWPMSS